MIHNAVSVPEWEDSEVQVEVKGSELESQVDKVFGVERRIQRQEQVRLRMTQLVSCWTAEQWLTGKNPANALDSNLVGLDVFSTTNPKRDRI